MPEPDLLPELERLWHTLATTHDRATFVEHLRSLKRLKQDLAAAEVDGRVAEWLSRIDHVVFRRTRRGTHSIQSSRPTALAWLALLCLPWPLLAGLLVGLTLTLTGHAQGWALGVTALVALYVARLGHELGHLLAGLPVFYLRGLYTSPNFVELRLETGVRAASVRPGHFIRLYLGGSVANLVLGLIGLAVAVDHVWGGIFVLSFVAANLALGLGNLLPLRRLSTDGYNAYRVWRAGHPAGPREQRKEAQP